MRNKIRKSDLNNSAGIKDIKKICSKEINKENEEGGNLDKEPEENEKDPDPALSDGASSYPPNRKRFFKIPWSLAAIIAFDIFLLIFVLPKSFKVANSDFDLIEDAQFQYMESEEDQTEVTTVKLSGSGIEEEESEDDIPAAPDKGSNSLANNNETEWREVIFGGSEASLLPSIKISGLNKSQKEKSGFRESDFLSKLYSFLDDHDITGVKEIIFEEEVFCSAQKAYAYQARLGALNDKFLNVIMYPDYPGYYLMTLQDVLRVSPETETRTENVIEGQPQIQMDGAISQEKTKDTEATAVYDATALSVKEIPASLLNYLDNQYELQYKLYDYLYRNGKAEVTWAEVNGYVIDPEEKTVEISFILSDGASLSCTYDKTGNHYSFR